MIFRTLLLLTIGLSLHATSHAQFATDRKGDHQFVADKLQMNDDGTVTITAPKLSNGMSIDSVTSNLHSICEAYGLKGYDFGYWYETSEQNANNLVTVKGALREISGPTQGKRIVWMICRNASPGVAALTSSRVSTHTVNVTDTELSNLEFLGPEGMNIPISTESHFDGVCKLYGYDHYVPGLSQEGPLKEKSTKYAVSIASGGGFRVMVKFDKSLAKSQKYIKKILCRRGQSYQIKSALTLDMASHYLTELSFVMDPVWSQIIKQLAQVLEDEYPITSTTSGATSKDFTQQSNQARYIVLYWLKPLFQSYDSLWFIENARPQIELFFSDLATQGLADEAQIAPDLGLTVALKVFGTIFQAGILPRLDLPQDQIWASDMIRMTNDIEMARALGGTGYAEFKVFYDRWRAGQPIRREWYQFQALSDANQVIEILGKYLERCYRN